MRALPSLALVVVALASSQPPSAQTPSQDPCSWSRDLKLVNGRIHTMDRRDLVVAEVTIQEGRFAAIGRNGNRARGSIEAGKLGDLVVLSDDYFDPRRVPDANLRQIKSVLTVVDGRIVYNDMR
jgi:predicted amidohydrolase YtcJ